MRFSATEVLSIADTNGFDAEVVEKVLHLMHLLNLLNSHPSLRGKWVLKGGTALNVFVFPFPRLSVDIDLNYIGKLERESMLADRLIFERAANAVFSREGFTVRSVPREHAGGKWQLSYSSYRGQSAALQVDLNYMFRQPFWPVHELNSYPLGDFQAKRIPVLDVHELAAGKLAALFARRQARDLFDCLQVLTVNGIQRDQLRIAFVVYGGMNRKDWRTVSLKDVDYDETELAIQLRPMLRAKVPQKRKSMEEYGAQLLTKCKKALSVVLPFTKAERAFLDQLLERGIIKASLLTSDTKLQERIKAQPMLNWKALHVRSQPT